MQEDPGAAAGACHTVGLLQVVLHRRRRQLARRGNQ